MSLLRVIRIVRHAAKLLLPYGIPRRLYGREAEESNLLRDILPFFIADAIWRERPPAPAEFAVQQKKTVKRLVEKMRCGAPLRVVFPVTNASIFPLRPLFDAMIRDESFDPSMLVIPDLRWRFDSPLPAMQKCFSDLAGSVPPERLSIAEKDSKGKWIDALGGADIVGYSIPYMDSYNPCFSPRRTIKGDFLAISANYGYYRSIFDRSLLASDFYAYMWKAFFECEATLDEYRRYAINGGSNADLTGYIKMDALAAATRQPASTAPRRKRILVALHHSVSDGMNKALELANFERFSDFFLSLPDRYPEIDFTFRPHPYLFKIMSNPFHWGAEKTDSYIAALKAKTNVTWSDAGDYFGDFASSDACIQDCGSYLVEYFYTKKPCCYMLKSEDDIDAKFAPLGRHCLENCYIAYDSDAIDDFIKSVVVGGHDPMKEKRCAFADSIMLNHPTAATIAMNHIKAALRDAAEQPPKAPNRLPFPRV